MAGSNHAATPPAKTAPPPSGGRRRWGMIFLVLLMSAAATGGYLTWYELVGKRFQSTNNAYVQANIVQITPQQAGTVVEIAARNTDFVQAGQVLVRLDPADAKLALEQAEAQLAQTVREVRALYGNNETLAAQIKARQAQVARARAQVRRLRSFYERRRELAKSGLVSSEVLNSARNELTEALSNLASARAAVAANEEQLSTSQSFTENTSIAEHPNVLKASAQIRRAMLTLERTRMRAPVSGYVARRQVQLGQRVEPGKALVSVVPLFDVWIDANFKESQLRDMRLGQPVELTSDIYGKEVVYSGKIDGLGAGTGAAFAILPPQNATGNWIKIIQRVPVRISIDKEQLQTHPLRVGLSMQATVNVENTDGQVLALVPRTGQAEILDVSSDFEVNAQATVSAIIARNLGAPNASLSNTRKIAAQHGSLIRPR